MKWDDGFVDDAIECLRCAEINFENAAIMMPLLRHHPIYSLAVAQLAAGIKRVEAEQEPDDDPATDEPDGRDEG